MTKKQLELMVRLALDDIYNVLEKMPESAEKSKLHEIADNLKTAVE
ncbi:MAG: hypothetical protein HDT43_11885 [Ruminococcaceae bacterium]|nr:hypothetical protein [Oscillospiraceae bacterium]